MISPIYDAASEGESPLSPTYLAIYDVFYSYVRALAAGDIETAVNCFAADAVIEGSLLRLRPIMMTALVATFGLLPAAMSHAIGSDSQRPFAIVIVGGLVAALAISVILLPTLYVWIARDGDKLPEAEESFEM